MGGFFGVASHEDCVFDLFYGTDYHSHLGTRRAGLAVYDRNKGFDRAIHNIESSHFRPKFEGDIQKMSGHLGIGCLSDVESQPLIIRSHLGTYAITSVGKINNADSIAEMLASKGHQHFLEMSGGGINPTELVASVMNQKDTITEAGTEILTPSDEMYAAMKEAAEPVYESIRGQIGDELVDIMLSLAEKYSAE